VTGSELLAHALKRQGVEDFFYLMGGPMLPAEKACLDLGIRGIDVRHEQAAAMAAHAYARVRRTPAVCMAASGPGTANLGTGVLNALVDCAPVVAIGGSSPVAFYGHGAFQEVDQVAIFRPLTKWAERAYHPARIPELVEKAFQVATSGCPGPVYLDLPGDVLYAEAERPKLLDQPAAALPWDAHAGPEDAQVEAALRMLEEAERPLVVSGSGTLWADAAEELRAFVERFQVPFFTTPQGRGVIPEDHELSFLTARATAFRGADLLLVVGTRLNFIVGHLRAPRFSATARVIQVDVDPTELGAHGRRIDLPICADAKAVLGRLASAVDGRQPTAGQREWAARLRAIDAVKGQEHEEAIGTDQSPIHPLRLCKEVRDVLPRDAVLVVDGHEILNYGRQTIPSFEPRHRLNSGPFGIMGVGVPFGLGAKAAQGDGLVVVLHGDGSFGLNAMELDTAVRHHLPFLCVISNNGGWSADPDRSKPGRDLGYTRYDRMVEAFGCHGEHVESPEDIRPALARALEAVRGGRPALVNVVTDYAARAVTARAPVYET
jgi:thiamine pyrophosphate-dependent acetolactate synthase large subunit-like protein